MNDTAQELLTQIHDMGYSDGNIAEVLEISREYVLRLRHGKKNASSKLLEDIKDFYKYIISEEEQSEKVDTTKKSPTRKTPVTPATENEEDEQGTIPLSVLVSIGIAFIVGCIGLARYLTSKSNR